MLGLLACVVAWAQPLNAVFRCHPTHTLRPIFKIIHGFFGFGAFLMASKFAPFFCFRFHPLETTNICSVCNHDRVQAFRYRFHKQRCGVGNLHCVCCCVWCCLPHFVASRHQNVDSEAPKCCGCRHGTRPIGWQTFRHPHPRNHQGRFSHILSKC